MDKKSIIGIILITVVFITWGIWTQPSQEEIKAAQRKKDSLEIVNNNKDNSTLSNNKDNKNANLAASQISNDSVSSKDSVSQAKLNEQYGAFGPSTIGREEIFTVESDLLKISFSNKGAIVKQVELKNFKTYDKKPLLLFSEDSSQYGISFYSNNRLINSQDLYFKNTTNQIIYKGDSTKIIYRLFANNNEQSGKYIEYAYTIHKGSYMIDYDIKLVNMNDLVVANSNSIDFAWKSTLSQKEKSLSNEKNNTTIYYRHMADKDVEYLSETKADEENISTSVDWISFKQQFFTSVLINEKGFTYANLKHTPKENKNLLKEMNAELGLPYSKEQIDPISMKFYFGPNKYKVLRKHKLDLEKQIPLGWSFFLMAWFNKYIVIEVFSFLESFNISYGIIILLLTLFVKLLLFPIAYKTYVSSAKIRLLKPEIEEINSRYPKSEDALKKQKATMELYKKAGASPMAGCVPMLLQFPILIALFRFFPASFELRQQGFLWADDLSGYDSILNLGFNIPFYGDHVSLFTLLMTISTIIYTRMNMDTMGSSNQMPGMKTMMYLMPILFLGIFNNYSSGLSYYYFLANMITFGQQFIFKKFIVNETKLHLQIQENKKKNANLKKSKFQMRLEQLAKEKAAQHKRK